MSRPKGSATPVHRCRGRSRSGGSPTRRRRCRFLLAPDRAYCAWHRPQTRDRRSTGPPPLRDGSLTLAELRRWALEYDAISEECWPAADFIAWLEPEQAPAAEPERHGRLHRPRLAEWPPLAYGVRSRAAG